MADLYLFEHTIGNREAVQYPMTDLTFDVEENGLVYEALPIRRSSIQGEAGTSDTDRTTVRIEIPRQHPLVRAVNRYAILPTLKIMSYSVDLKKVISVLFNGGITRPLVLTSAGAAGTDSEAGIAVFEVAPNPQYLFDGLHQSWHYQATCNLVLYSQSGGCFATRRLHSLTTTVEDRDAQGLSFTLARFRGSTGPVIAARLRDDIEAGYYQGGSAEFEGSYRKIIRHVGRNIQLEVPFADPVPIGSAITISAGCDRRYETCVRKFRNGNRFGGHIGIPIRNPGDRIIGQSDVESEREPFESEEPDTRPIEFVPIGARGGFN